MVHLLLVSSKGNNVRYFPYTGYLGLTPVKVEGAVCTKLDSDLKPLQAKSITVSVRCYESRLGRLGSVQTNVLVDHSQTLWTKPDGQEYDAVGDGEYPFRISLPPTVAGFSTISFVEYRCVWRVEAVLNHIPITGIGSRQVKHVDLPLIRYDMPPNLPSYGSAYHDSEPRLDRQTAKPRGPRISYSMNTPKFPIGPTDLVSIPIHILPTEPGVSIRSATLVVERRIFLNDTTTPTSSHPHAPSTSSFSNQHPLIHSHTSQSAPASSSIPHTQFSSSSSSLALSGTSYANEDAFSSIRSISSTTALLPGNGSGSHSTDSLAARAVVTPVAGTDSSGPFARSPSGVWSKTLTFPWPSVKSSGRWGIGETIQSDLIAVKFFVRVKVIVTSSYGTDSVELDEEELFVMSTNDSERRIAEAKYRDITNSSDRSRSKSKSPRRSRRERENAPEPPVPSTSAGDRSPCHPSPSIPSSTSPTKNKTPRRPHTSAGPRDKPFASTGARTDSPYGKAFDASRQSHHDHEDEAAPYRRKLRPGTATSPEITKSSVSGFVYSPMAQARVSVSTRRNPGVPFMSNASDATTPSSTSIHSGLSMNIRDSANIREWEEELARIEVQSRRSSDLLGFGLRRKRPSTTAGRTPFSLFAGKA
ncbi:hypothetical protein V5O48_002059 [Marasmius crinis-equi]|uniref:Arrestin C-terminal-like domain-containing protein n=1 Tax=Marasmius crinis-equi TaxID=585013 RepID=A0ABR3FWV3_9AGAR